MIIVVSGVRYCDAHQFQPYIYCRLAFQKRQRQENTQESKRFNGFNPCSDALVVRLSVVGIVL
jgi:hypothetical protein